jgi:hypothetical protein
MKRLAAFVLLAAVLLGILVWIDAHRRAAVRSTRPVAETPSSPTGQEPPAPADARPQAAAAPPSAGAAAASPDGQEGFVPLVTGQQGERGQTQVRVSGEIDVVDKAEVSPGKFQPRTHVRAEDTKPVGDGDYELVRASAEYFEPTTQVLERRVTAATWLTRLQSVSAGLGFAPEFENVLRDVRVELLDDPRFSPMTIDTAELRGRAAEQSLRTAEAVHVEGRGLSARGQGLGMSWGEQRLLTIERDVVATLQLTDRSSLRFSCKGSWRVFPLPDRGKQWAMLEARDEARLAWSQAESLDLTADLVRVEGKVDEQGGGFLASQVWAEGGVLLTTSDGSFRGQSARIDFDPQGQPRSALVEGDPSGETWLRDVSASGLGTSAPGSAGLRDLKLSVQGKDRLDVTLGEPAGFELTGPATLEVWQLGLVLNAEGALKGTRALGGGYAAMEALGGVELHRASTDSGRAPPGLPRLTAPYLKLEYTPDPEQGPAPAALVRLRTEGRTTVEATSERADPIQVNAQGLVALMRGQALEVEEASDVELEVRGPAPWRARAGRVERLDARSLTFLALQNVEFEGAEVRGEGAQLESLGQSHFTLRGDEQRLANLDLGRGRGALTAGWIDLQPEGLFAQVGVRLHLTGNRDSLDLSSRWLSLDARFAPQLEGAAGSDEPEGLAIDAGGEVRAQFGGGSSLLSWSSDFVRVEAERCQPDDPAAVQLRGRSFAPRVVEGLGQVSFASSGDLELSGTCGRLRLDSHTGLLDPTPAGQVYLHGRIPGRSTTFDLLARSARFTSTELSALDAELDADGVILPFGSRQGSDQPASLRATARQLFADRNSLLLVDGARLERVGSPMDVWTIDAGRLRLSGSFAALDPKLPVSAELSAWDGFTARMGLGIQITGSQLRGQTGVERLDIVGEPATVSSPQFSWKSDWFEFDAQKSSLRSGQGELTTTSTETGATWRMQYSSLQPVEREDATIQVFREPVFHKGANKLRASWALFWVDTREWNEQAKSAFGARNTAVEPEPPVPARKARRQRRGQLTQNLFGAMESVWVASWLQEVYLDGNVEYQVGDERLFRCDALYLDLVGGLGWVREIDMAVPAPFEGEAKRLKLKASWLRHSADGSLFASNALATTCEHDDPHYVVRIGELSMTPRVKERPRRPTEPGTADTVKVPDGWDTTLGGMSIVLWGDAQIPLPRTSFPLALDADSLTPKIRGRELSVFGLQPLSIGSSAKLGNFIGVRFRNELGWVGARVHRLLSVTPTKLPETATIDYSARFSNSRGIPVGAEVEVSDETSYRIRFNADGLFDQGEDKGLVRVPSDEREDWRGWYRLRGRFKRAEEEWIDVVFSRQTDPGIQAEFFESDYLRFEERESYVHWRRAAGDLYTSATFEAYLEDFRSEVVEAPSVRLYDGRSVLGQLFGQPLLFSSNTSLARLERHNGTVESPFPDVPGLPDPPDERHVVRLDSEQRLDLPMPLGFLGLRAVPFLSGRVTGWDRSALDDEAQSRLAAIAGLELSTTVWKRFESGTLHTLSPVVAVRGDLGVEQSSGELVTFDAVEDPIEGKFLDLGLRSRMDHPGQPGFLDVELRQTHASDVPQDADDGWLPTQVRSTWLSQLGSIPFAVSHDARYDIEDHVTPYSRSIFSLDPIEDFGVELGYHSARDEEGDSLYNALSLGARYDLSPKWQAEGRYTFSTQGDGRLASHFLLRRMGHDFVIEMDTGFTAGEGTSAFGVNVIPRTLWRRGDTTLLERWLARKE